MVSFKKCVLKFKMKVAACQVRREQMTPRRCSAGRPWAQAGGVGCLPLPLLETRADAVAPVRSRTEVSGAGAGRHVCEGWSSAQGPGEGPAREPAAEWGFGPHIS